MPRGRALKTTGLIEAAIAILREIEPASVRAVCYQLFNQRAIPDMSKNATGRVSRVLVRAREEGLVPWDWIVDETRAVELAATWDDPDTYMEVVADSYRRDRWGSQPERVMVVSEKGTVAGVLRPVLADYGVPFGVYHGFGSATAVRDLAERSVADHRPLTILYVGDHDPSGRYMSDRDLPDRLDRYGGVARIERVAVTPQHIIDYDLLTFSADQKTADARHAWFARTYGRTCCELDALDPRMLRRLIEDAILDHLDLDAWELAGTTEAAEMASLHDFFAAWPAA
jgi:hypothetical protein